jgi:hypothetical protein
MAASARRRMGSESAAGDVNCSHCWQEQALHLANAQTGVSVPTAVQISSSDGGEERFLYVHWKIWSCA